MISGMNSLAKTTTVMKKTKITRILTSRIYSKVKSLVLLTMKPLSKMQQIITMQEYKGPTVSRATLH